jgi:hypothetical protein
MPRNDQFKQALAAITPRDLAIARAVTIGAVVACQLVGVPRDLDKLMAAKDADAAMRKVIADALIDGHFLVDHRTPPPEGPSC